MKGLSQHGRSVSDETSAEEFVNWVNKTWSEVPKGARAAAKMSVHGLLHMPTNECPPRLSVMVGIQHETER